MELKEEEVKEYLDKKKISKEALSDLNVYTSYMTNFKPALKLQLKIMIAINHDKNSPLYNIVKHLLDVDYIFTYSLPLGLHFYIDEKTNGVKTESFALKVRSIEEFLENNIEGGTIYIMDFKSINITDSLKFECIRYYYTKKKFVLGDLINE